MPKVKTLLITVLVIAFALSLSGCGMLLSRRAEPELAASLDGELPEWLLLSHRSEETIEADDVTNLKDPADEEEEDESAIGGSDEDDGVTAPSSDQVASTQPAPSSTPSSTPSSSSSSIFETPQPGTRQYLIWFSETGGQGSYEEWLKAKIKAEEDKKKQEELNAPMANFGTTSPSGFRIFDDDDE